MGSIIQPLRATGMRNHLGCGRERSLRLRRAQMSNQGLDGVGRVRLARFSHVSVGARRTREEAMGSQGFPLVREGENPMTIFRHSPFVPRPRVSRGDASRSRLAWLRSAVLMLAMMLAGVPARAQTLGRRGSHDPKAACSRLVIVGDSLAAGFQNGSLLDSQQPHGYAALVAAQAGVPLTLPLIAPPGIPNVLELISVGPPPNIIRAPGTSTGRDDIFAQATNLAVPGHNVEDALVTRPGPPIDDLTDLVLGPPGLLAGLPPRQPEWAEALHPTTILVWIVNNDVHRSAR